MSDTPAEKLTFEQDVAELETVVRDLEDGQAGLEESLARYEVGIRLLKRCYTQLAQMEQRILVLAGEDAEGNPITGPFDHAATAGAEAGAPKRQRKSPEK